MSEGKKVIEVVQAADGTLTFYAEDAEGKVWVYSGCRPLGVSWEKESSFPTEIRVEYDN